MTGTGSMGLKLQQQLSEFMYAEMAHTFGSYGIACDRLERLADELSRNCERWKSSSGTCASGGGDRQPTAMKALKAAVEAAKTCNANLHRDLHSNDSESRKPSPYADAGVQGEEGAERLLSDVAAFYETSETALTKYREALKSGTGSDTSQAARLGRRLAFVHDPQRRRDAGRPESEDGHLANQIERAKKRRKYVGELGGEVQAPASPQASATACGRPTDLLEAWVGTDRPSLLESIVEAFVEAHMAMHQVEHLRAVPFGEMITNIPKTHLESRDLLRRSLALNTFVFAAARAVPWVFAEDQAERDFVLDNYAECCETLAPTYCIWLSAQFSLLALHRRAFTWWSLGNHDRAYRDFHKLNRLLRGLRGPAERRGLRVPGTRTFIEGVTAMSELHIGRIYRGQHAHRLALRYFDRARGHLGAWESDAEVGALIKDSRWRLDLMINQGKANYELGRLKRSILCYASAWRAFLQLVETETHATANLEVVDEFIAWLEPVVDDPELNRRELRDRIEPLVDQFVTLRAPPHLRLAAADIVMRVGHLLFILRLPPARRNRACCAASGSDHRLAAKCIGKAAYLDPANTLAAADRLRIEHETGKEVKTEGEVKPVGLKDHWPSGGGRFEQAARITEYTLQLWLNETRPGYGGTDTEGAQDGQVARELLGAFLAHTDSSNVKLAQVYRYLMQPPRGTWSRETSTEEFTMNLVCLRRYSSFFPFLPRPRSFRAPGGGYFVRLRECGKEAAPFGIAIDPGPSFIENLYRCGYGLADIHMIVITHDHADHIASLDALLALIDYRRELDEVRFSKAEKLAIVGNESVCDRYSFFKKKENGTLKVLTFKEIWEITKNPHKRAGRVKAAKIFLLPETLTIEPVRSWNHDDTAGSIAQAFLLGLGPVEDRSTILFTGDTGLPPDLAKESGGSGEEHEGYAAGDKDLSEAIKEADIVVAHLSSVPLRELRELAELNPETSEAVTEYREIWEKAVGKAKHFDGMRADNEEGFDQTRFLLKQIRFGFRTRGAIDKDELSVSPLSDLGDIREQRNRHLYLTGLLGVAQAIAGRTEEEQEKKSPPVLLIGELREELGTFRTRIASSINRHVFGPGEGRPKALTADIGLRLRLSGPSGGERSTRVLCSTCDLDNDLIPEERFHPAREIQEVCVKGEDEGVFYACALHDPNNRDDNPWLEAVERYDVFGD